MNGALQSGHDSLWQRLRPRLSPLLDWARSMEGVALFLFVFGSVFLHGEGQLRFFGLLLCGAVLVSFVRRPGTAWRKLLPVPTEVLLYAAWVAWAGLTGLISSADLGEFWQGFRVILQMLVMVGLVYAVLRIRPEALPGVFVAVVCGGIVQVGAVLSGFTAVAETRAGDRLMGMTGNPNILGFMMTWTVLCSLVLWGLQGKTQNWLRRGSWILILLCAYVLLASGSRKSMVAFAFLVTSWALFASTTGRDWVSVAVRVLTTGLVITTFYVVLPFVLERSVAGRRFDAIQDDGAVAIRDIAESEGRTEMYKEGFRMFEKNPIAGVGLNNFAVHYWKGGYSHSDYIEPLATTGLVGFLLYQAFYVLVLWRSIRLLPLIRNFVVRHWFKMIIIGTLTIMLIGLGSPHYDNQVVFILLTTFSVYTCAVASKVRRRTGLAYPPELFVGYPSYTSLK